MVTHTKDCNGVYMAWRHQDKAYILANLITISIV